MSGAPREGALLMFKVTAVIEIGAKLIGRLTTRNALRDRQSQPPLRAAASCDGPDSGLLN